MTVLNGIYICIMHSVSPARSQFTSNPNSNIMVVRWYGMKILWCHCSATTHRLMCGKYHIIQVRPSDVKVIRLVLHGRDNKFFTLIVTDTFVYRSRVK